MEGITEIDKTKYIDEFKEKVRNEKHTPLKRTNRIISAKYHPVQIRTEHNSPKL